MMSDVRSKYVRCRICRLTNLSIDNVILDLGCWNVNRHFVNQNNVNRNIVNRFTSYSSVPPVFAIYLSASVDSGDKGYLCFNNIN